MTSDFVPLQLVSLCFSLSLCLCLSISAHLSVSLSFSVLVCVSLSLSLCLSIMPVCFLPTLVCISASILFSWVVALSLLPLIIYIYIVDPYKHHVDLCNESCFSGWGAAWSVARHMSIHLFYMAKTLASNIMRKHFNQLFPTCRAYWHH